MRKISYLGWGFLLFGLILSGCGKLERKGTKPANIPPLIFFVNVPPESIKVSVNPLVYWYGTDKDGYITAYQYAVIRDSVIDIWGDLEAAKDSLRKIGPDSASWADNTYRMDIFGAHIAAEKGHQRNVRLYAAEVETVYTPQHVFLRAVDNHDGISDIKTRMFWRNNHAPEVFVDVDSEFVETNFYCLPETTQTWKGIDILWHGLDTLDYEERKQPDFYFKWDLYGPYADTSNLEDANATKVDSSLFGTEIGGDTIYDRWVLDQSYTFKNLENYPDAGYGWYQFRVWSRDDAFVSSKDSATTFFRILKPLFWYPDSLEKTIFVLNATDYTGKADGRVSAEMVREFYDSALSELRRENICDGFNIYELPADSLPSEDSLSRYDLVIVLNLGKTGHSEDDFCKYRNYLNVGGRLWFIGPNNYGLTGPRGIHYIEVDVPSGQPCTRGVPTEYLGVEGLFLSGYAPKYPSTLEFIAAESFGSWEFPLLQMDSVKAAKLEGARADSGWNYPEFGIPRVSYLVLSDFDSKGRGPLQRRVYSFVSRHDRNSEMHKMPCATTFIGPTYRTAEFSFPLSVMKDYGDGDEPGALEAFKKMVEWFFPEP